METQTHSRDINPQADDGTALPPYPLTRGDIGFWLRRGEQLGRAACRLAAAVAAGHKRAAQGRHAASRHPIDPPAQPG